METNVKNELKIDKSTYAIAETNRYKVKSVKTQIVIATSLRKNSYHITRLQHKEIGNSKKWNTYTINRDGSVIFQHYDDKHHTDFLDIKAGDKQSISIVLENMGCLFELPDKTYINWLNEECPMDRVAEKKWLGYNYWEKFDDQQINALAKLCIMLCEKHNIPKDVINFQHYHKDIHRFKGIVFRSNYVEDSSDINPMFNLTKFTKLIK